MLFIRSTVSRDQPMDPMRRAMELYNSSYKHYDADDDVSVLDLLDDSVHTCPHCGSKRVLVSEMQTRSADEGATVTYTCAQCMRGF